MKRQISYFNTPHTILLTVIVSLLLLSCYHDNVLDEINCDIQLKLGRNKTRFTTAADLADLFKCSLDAWVHMLKLMFMTVTDVQMVCWSAQLPVLSQHRRAKTTPPIVQECKTYSVILKRTRAILVNSKGNAIRAYIRLSISYKHWSCKENNSNVSK